MRGRKRLIVGCVVLFTVFTFVVTLAWRRVAPRYTAVAYLGISPLHHSDFFGTDQQEFKEARTIGAKAAHAEMLQREVIYIRTLESQEVKDTDWYRRDPDGALERLVEILDVAPVRKEMVIAISITDVAPEEQDRIDLAEIANAVAEAYVQDVCAAASLPRAVQIKRLRNKLAELHKRSDAIRAQIKEKLTEIESTQKQVAAEGARLEELAAQGIELKQAKIQIEAPLKRLEKHARAGTVAEMPEVAAMVENDPNVKALREEESKLEARLAGLLKKYGPNHRLVLSTKTQLATTGKRLAQTIKEAVPVHAQALKEQLVDKLEQVTGELLRIKGLIADIHDSVEGDLQRKLPEMRDLRAREKTIAENIRKISDTLLYHEPLVDADRPVWLAAKATTPKTITSPKWTVTMPLGVLFGLAVGLALAFYLGPKTS